jgi:hypothetical protein
MEQLEYNLLFPWFVGLNMDEPVWVATVFGKNRDRLLEGEIAAKFFAQVLDQARANHLLSDEHFSVDGTLIEAWASQKSFQRIESKAILIFLSTIACHNRKESKMGAHMFFLDMGSLRPKLLLRGVGFPFRQRRFFNYTPRPVEARQRQAAFFLPMYKRYGLV